MTLTHILVFAGLSLPFMGLVPARWRAWGLLVGSILALGWLGKSDTFDGLEFALPAATVILTILVWWIVQPPDQQREDDLMVLGLIAGTMLVLWVILSWDAGKFAFVPLLSGAGLVCVGAVGVVQMMPRRAETAQREIYRQAALLLIGSIIVILVMLKIPATARFLGEMFGSVVSISPLAWLGFSYVAFRLMALLFDYRAGRLPKEGFALRDMAVYVLFFPAYTAGPIDRAQRFIPELAKTHGLDPQRLVDGSTRIAVGVFKKFVVADSLARVAMNPTLIERTEGVAGLWLILYIYTFQIFLDFSGYSDVAIGLSKLYGITLPENFDRPYLQRNLQQFWQRWHITLATWFRIYFFTPFSRMMVRSEINYPQYFIILLAQIGTMVLIGLWHGITLNFVLWGLWHGVGLFLLKYMTDHTKGWTKRVNQRVWSRRLLYGSSVLATFHFVALGWVFFALPDVDQSVEMLRRLLGG